MGRAILFLEQCSDASPHREIILHACLHDVAFDTQLSDSRGLYLYDVIHATGEPEFYGPCIREALADPEAEGDEDQIFDLCALLAREGDQAAREVMYAAFRRNVEAGDSTGAEAIIAMDGIDGYAFVAQGFAAFPLPEDEAWQETSAFETFVEHVGEQNLPNALAGLAAQNPALAPYLAMKKAHWEEWLCNRGKPLPAVEVPDYAALKSMLDSSEAPRSMRYRTWGRNLDDDTAARLAADTLTKTDPVQIEKYLRLFDERPFPLNHRRLLEWAKSDEEKLAWQAVRSLGNISHSTVRDLALELAATPGRERESVLLLRNNADTRSDGMLLEQIVARPLTDVEFHWLGVQVRDYLKQNSTPSAPALLTALYENGPCVLCRESVIEMWLEIGPLPEAIRAECRYDAAPGIREKANAS